MMNVSLGEIIFDKDNEGKLKETVLVVANLV